MRHIFLITFYLVASSAFRNAKAFDSIPCMTINGLTNCPTIQSSGGHSPYAAPTDSAYNSLFPYAEFRKIDAQAKEESEKLNKLYKEYNAGTLEENQRKAIASQMAFIERANKISEYYKDLNYF